MFIGGQWVDSESGKVQEAWSPATGETIAELPRGTRDDARRAIDAANRAELTLRSMTPLERSQMCHRIADVIETRVDELAQVLTLDQGKPYQAEARGEAGFFSHFFRQAAEDILRLNGETIPSTDRNKRVISFYQSRGTYAVITPWNFPYNIPSEYISAALAAGNPVVWVPAPTTSVCAVKYAECLAEAELPQGAFNLVIGDGPVVGDEIVTNSGTVGVAFTGSTVTGELIARRGAGKPMLLELGGNGPVIVLDDADLDAAANGIALSAFLNAGQACSATERVFAMRGIHDALLERVVAKADAVRLGDPFADLTTMGPLNNEATAQKMDRHIADALEKGARVVRGGSRAAGFPTDLYYQATVLEGVTKATEIQVEESFGPIVPLIDVDSYDEAIELANGNRYGLICSVYTKNLKAAFHFGERLRTGIVNINETPDYWETHIPYGGVAGKRSGIGRLGGMNTLREMMDIRSMIIDLEKGGF
jgi:succinate-semialdehyde dehydrogenase/glutarate-semialdehyde dehydrogenase